MRIRGFFELGAPYIAGLIKCPDLDLAVPLRLLIDTGASRTVISDKDAVKLGLDYAKLEKLESGLIGIGGEVETYALNRVSLLFRSNGGIHEEEIDIMVLRHQKMNGRVRKIPSLLGRDILNKYALSMSAKKNFVEIKEDLSL